MNEPIKKQQGILNQQEKELAAIYHSAAIRYGISDSELWVWYALLVWGGEYSQQDICDIWSLPKQTVNSVIANLTKKRLCIPGNSSWNAQPENHPSYRSRKSVW